MYIIFKLEADKTVTNMGLPTLGSYRGKWQEDGRLTSISSQIVRWLTTSLISLNIWMWDRWKRLYEKKGVEAKDCDELMKMIVSLLIFVFEKSDTDRRNRVYWSHSLIFRRHSHYCTSIQTSLQFIIHINSSMSISTC